jgi:phospholipase D1/2
MPPKHRERFQLVVTTHPATFNAPEERTEKSKRNAELLLSLSIGAVLKSLNGKPGRFADTPGLWSLIEQNAKGGKFRQIKDASPTILLGSHHQKLLIVDEEVAFVGGLDVVKGRVDSTAHTQMAWHDSMCRVEGAPVGDLLRNFRTRWNEEAPIFQDFVKRANEASKKFKIESLKTTELAAGSGAGGAKGELSAQIHRTVSRRTDRKNSLPETVRADIAEAYEKAIGAARQFIYIENQYFRSRELVRWLLEALDRVADLQLIIVVPVAPEEVKGEEIDLVTDHGLFLQHSAFENLKRAFERNRKAENKGELGVYSMIAQRKAGKQSPTNVSGSHQIYVHNKCLIVDDVYAHVGSANTNPRSFTLDTEAGVGWFDAVSVRALREELWSELLGKPNLKEWSVSDYVKRWNEIADANLKLKTPKEFKRRKGFVIPHKFDAFRGHDHGFEIGKLLGVSDPDRLVQVFDRSPGVEVA